MNSNAEDIIIVTPEQVYDRYQIMDLKSYYFPDVNIKNALVLVIKIKRVDDYEYDSQREGLEIW